MVSGLAIVAIASSALRPSCSSDNGKLPPFFIFESKLTVYFRSQDEWGTTLRRRRGNSDSTTLRLVSFTSKAVLGQEFIACEDSCGNIKRFNALHRDPGFHLGVAHVGDWYGARIRSGAPRCTNAQIFRIGYSNRRHILLCARGTCWMQGQLCL